MFYQLDNFRKNFFLKIEKIIWKVNKNLALLKKNVEKKFGKKNISKRK